MHKSLSSEVAQETLHNTMLQVKVDYVVIHCARVFEYNGPNGRVAAPFPEFFITLARRPQGVHRLGPRRVRTVALIDRGEAETRGTGFAAAC